MHTIWIRELFCMMRRLGSLKCILLNYRDGLIGGSGGGGDNNDESDTNAGGDGNVYDDGGDNQL